MKVWFGAAALVFWPLSAAYAEPPAPDTCRLSLTARFIGARAVDEVRQMVRQNARPHPVRWIAPGQAITIDQNPQRLNVIIDETSRITAMRCG